MKLKKSLAMVAVALLLVPFAVLAENQDTQKIDQEMMEAFIKYSTPNENHKRFEKFVGEWDADVKAWMEPGSNPNLSKGTAKSKLIFGGRYLYTKFESTFMEQPFQGMQIMGYNNLTNNYNSFWIDNMGTGFYLTSGVLDETGNVLTETGVWPDPMTGETKVRIITKWINDDKFINEIHGTGLDGKEFKMLEVTYTRKK